MKYKDDLTIVYYTGNKIKNKLGRAVRKNLREISKKTGYPIVSVSQKTLSGFGHNICVGDIGYEHLNVYRQMLIGAKAVKTKYLAIAEDDTLYSPSHFTEYRPANDTFGYDMTKWSVYTWKDCYSVKRRISGPTIIVPTKLFIEALEERFEKAIDKPIKFWAEFGRYENHLGVKVQKFEKFWSTHGVIIFSHEDTLGFRSLGKRKRLGEFRAYDIPYWGHVNKYLELYND